MPQIHQVPAGNAGQQQQVQMIPQAPSVWQKCAYFLEGSRCVDASGHSVGFPCDRSMEEIGSDAATMSKTPSSSATSKLVLRPPTSSCRGRQVKLLPAASNRETEFYDEEITMEADMSNPHFIVTTGSANGSPHGSRCRPVHWLHRRHGPDHACRSRTERHLGDAEPVHGHEWCHFCVS